MPDLTWREGLVMAPLLGLIVFLGVYPKPMLDRIEPSVDAPRRPHRGPHRLRRARGGHRRRRRGRRATTPSTRRVSTDEPLLALLVAAARRGPDADRRRRRGLVGASRRSSCWSAARCCCSSADVARRAAQAARGRLRAVHHGHRRSRPIGAAVPLWDRVQDADRGPFSTLGQAVGVDGFSVFATVMICAAVILGALLLDGWLRREGMEGAEPYVLMLLSASGGVMMASANDLIVMFLGLEILSIAVYVLAAMHLRKVTSQEAGVKYFVLGAFSSAFFLYGIALDLRRHRLHQPRRDLGVPVHHRAGRQRPAARRPRRCCSSGFGFKVAAVPFHFWTPDVYQGAPEPERGVDGLGREGGRLRRAAAGLLPGLRHLPASTGSRSSTPSPRSRWSSARCSPSCRPT